ncbi:MAG: MCE family protein [Actinobacteria bacterium]|nr:MAG: MCE family protein [Actinomycetota bacterium]
MRRNQKRQISPFGAGLIAIVVSVIAIYFGFTKAIPFQHHYTIKAAFNTVNNIKKGSFVRIAGVNVGKVSDVSFLHQGQQAAVVSMRIDDKGLPIHTDATAKIRPRIFLEGNFFVDLSPGSPSAPVLRDGQMLPISQTAAPVQLDQVLSTLQSSTRADLQRLLAELSSGFSGQGAAGFNRSLQYQGEAYRTGSIVSDATLGTAEHDLSGYIATSGATAQALDRFPAQLQSLITDFNTTANALAVQSNALSAAIHELPLTLRAGLPALAALNNALPPVRRFARDFLPGTRSSGPAIDASLPFVAQVRGLVSKPELRGLVADLRPTVPSLIALNRASVPLYQQTRAAASCQNQVILPWSLTTIQDKDFPASGPVYEEQAKALEGTGGESRAFDANGIWFRVLIGAGFAFPSNPGQFTLSALPVVGANPPPPAEKPQFREDVPCETQNQQSLASTPSGAPRGEFRIDTTSSAAQAKINQANDALREWLRAGLKREGLDKLIGVSNGQVTPEQVPHLKELATFRNGQR